MRTSTLSANRANHTLVPNARHLSLAACLACSLAFVPSASKAESSAPFVGVELGYGEGRANTDQAYLRGVQYGITAGYKQFFMPYVGLRYYANFSVMHAPGVYDKDGNDLPQYDKTTSLLNYGANIDLLANFVAGEDFDFGAFVGVGVGAYTWLRSGYIEQQAPKNAKLTHLDVALNVGLRTNIAKNHGIEVLGRVSFLDGKVYNNPATNGNPASTLKVSHPYSVTARYTYSF